MTFPLFNNASYALFSYVEEDMMKNQEKRWYTVEEALEYLQIEELVFWRKMTFFHISTRILPGMKGYFVARRDLLFLVQRIQPNRTPNDAK